MDFARSFPPFPVRFGCNAAFPSLSPRAPRRHHGNRPTPLAHGHPPAHPIVTRFADPGEHNNIAESLPGQVAKMQAKLAELRRSAYSEPSNMQTALCQAKVVANGNFYGPFINGSGPAPGLEASHP